MRIRFVTEADRHPLLNIWLRSMRESHGFVGEEMIQHFLPLVRDGLLRHFEVWIVESDDDESRGFMVLSGNKIEAIFVAPEYFRRGGGRLLIRHARALKGPLKVDVHEQNARARSFYAAMGFVVERRSAWDGSGKPFPLLHLRDSSAGETDSRPRIPAHSPGGENDCAPAGDRAHGPQGVETKPSDP